MHKEKFPAFRQQGKLAHPRDPVEGVQDQVLGASCFNSRFSRFQEQFYSVVMKDRVIVKGHETKSRVCLYHSKRIVQWSRVNIQADQCVVMGNWVI